MSSCLCALSRHSCSVSIEQVGSGQKWHPHAVGVRGGVHVTRSRPLRRGNQACMEVHGQGQPRSARSDRGELFLPNFVDAKHATCNIQHATCDPQPRPPRAFFVSTFAHCASYVCAFACMRTKYFTGSAFALPQAQSYSGVCTHVARAHSHATHAPAQQRVLMRLQHCALAYGCACTGIIAMQVRSVLGRTPPFLYHNWVQRHAWRLIKARWFEPLILVLIVCNCLLMTAEDPLCAPVHPDGSRCSFLCSRWEPISVNWGEHHCSDTAGFLIAVLELLLLCCFTLEATIKLGASISL